MKYRAIYRAVLLMLFASSAWATCSDFAHLVDALRLMPEPRRAETVQAWLRAANERQQRDIRRAQQYVEAGGGNPWKHCVSY